MGASLSLSPTFLNDLAAVYAILRPEAPSAAFLLDLAQVYASLPGSSDGDLRLLAERFDKWRNTAREHLNSHLKELDADDPLLCRISLFRTMDSGRLETAHTRTLAWLLDPGKDEEHGFSDTLMAALLEQLANRSRFDRLYVQEVVSEYPLEGSAGKGRFDILARGEWERSDERVRWILVIEAKVDAWEGEGQLDKYDEWLASHADGREIYLVFLTADGRESETGCDEWKPWSFLKLVQVFRQVYPHLATARGFHFLRFYLAGVLQDICGWPRHVTADAPDPYAIASYLNAVHASRLEGASDDAAG